MQTSRRVNLSRWLVFFLLLSGIACRAVTGLPARVAIQPGSATPILLTASPTASATATTLPAFLPSLTPSPEPPLPSAAIGLPPDVQVEVRLHPEGSLVVGDQVSFEVILTAGDIPEDATVAVSLPGQEPLGQAQFHGFGIGRRAQATLYWAWDTRGLAPGEYSLAFTLQPGGSTWSETIRLDPVDILPKALAEAQWAQASSQCCTVHYMTGTAAERDLDELLLKIDTQAQAAAAQIGVDFSEPITITLLPRLLGHGGFAGDEIHISYLDRNYAGGDPDMVLHHEMIHILDARLGGELRPSLLVEGLAVYLSGGHFRPEPLMPRAAALLPTWGTPARAGLGWYIPLQTLADNFYRSQHEIGYLQAGALIEFMVDTWGWEKFSAFYRGIQPHSSGSQAQAMDSALQAQLGLTLDELEARFTRALRSLPADETFLTDVRLSVQYYDSVRRYQQRFDPSAYFLTAWLVDTAEMRQRGIVADYLRYPAALTNLTLETMLASAGENLQDGQYGSLEAYIEAVNAVLDSAEQAGSDPLSASLLAVDHAALIQAALDHPEWIGAAAGDWIVPQRIWLDGDIARIWVAVGGSQLVEVQMAQDGQGGWQFSSANMFSR